MLTGLQRSLTDINMSYLNNKKKSLDDTDVRYNNIESIDNDIYEKTKYSKIFFKKIYFYVEYSKRLNVNKFSKRDNKYFNYCIKNFKMIDGLCLEFGTFKGERIQQIKSCLNKNDIIYGFDSFEGLHEDWIDPISGKKIMDKKSFNLDGILPEIKDPNIKLVKGYFKDSIPKFLKEQNIQDSDSISLLHIDCDLKSSTIDVFENISHLIKPGTLILFDDLHSQFCTHWWDEYIVFEEYAKKYNWNYEFVALVFDGGQGALVIK